LEQKMAMDTNPSQPEQFISEAIVPVAGSFNAAAMSRGEPGLPAQFTWRGATYAVARLLSTWKTSTAERGEMYLRRHWFSIETTSGEHMTLYCERQTKNSRQPKARWWLYTIQSERVPDPADGRDPLCS
jgi:hypothetical protein